VNLYVDELRYDEKKVLSQESEEEEIDEVEEFEVENSTNLL